MTGKILDESSSDYHGSDAVSHSKLETFRKRPLLFKKRYIDKALAPESSAAFVIGSALHCAVLELDEYPHRYVTRPDGIDRRTKAGKEAYEAFCAANDGKEVLEREDAELVGKMSMAIREHQIAAQLLSKGLPEVTWRTFSSGIPAGIQCRTDWINEAEGYVVDVKTVDNLDGDQFTRNVVNFGYHRQLGFYSHVLAACGHTDLRYYFVCVEKREPFGVQVYCAQQKLLEIGYRESLADLERMAACFASGNWPNIPTDIVYLGLPEWYKEAK